MTAHVALLRAVNVGGTGKLPMSDLRRICSELGLAEPETYIQSGNVVFGSELDEPALVAALGEVLAPLVGPQLRILVRSPDELEAVLRRNPFPAAPTNRVLVTFLPEAPASDEPSTGPDGERVVVDGREVFVHYPEGLGRSKLRLAGAAEGTARNLNTIARLVDLARTHPAA
ncbi:MAG: DUF1697 domain-containing protein [Gaiellales bacterium]